MRIAYRNCRELMPTARRRVFGRHRRQLAAVVAPLALLACVEAAPPEPPSDAPCEAPYVAGSDPFPEQVEPVYARNFSVEYDGATKLVRVRNPWRGADVEVRYLLVQCGAEVPPVPDSTRVVRIPVRSVVTTSTTQLPSLVALGVVDRLVGHDGFDYVNSPAVVERIRAGEMVEVGDTSNLNTEVLIELDPELVLAFVIGDSEYDVPAKLRGSRLPVVLSASYMEQTPLARSEWIKFIALFFNREAEANRLFDEVATRYRSLAERAAGAAERPTVLVGAPFRGVWHVAGGSSFIARFLADAGADYLWADDASTGGVPLDLETVFARAYDADFWVNPSGWRSLKEGLAIEPRFAEFAAVRAGRVFNNNARLNEAGGNDYWETGSLRPDLVLADLLRIFHPDLVSDHELYFYQRLE